MRLSKSNLFVIVILSIFVYSCTDKSSEKKIAEVKKPVYEANWESIKANYKDPEWFNKTKFGISKLPKYIKNVCTSQ